MFIQCLCVLLCMKKLRKSLKKWFFNCNKHRDTHTQNEEGRYDYYHNAFISSQEHIMLVINFSQVGHQRQHLHKCVFFFSFKYFLLLFLRLTIYLQYVSCIPGTFVLRIYMTTTKKSQLPASFLFVYRRAQPLYYYGYI